MSCQGTVSPKGARKLHDADVVYLYDGSFEGFLCCVYESFAQHELPFAVWTPQRENGHPLPGQGHCHRPRRCPAGIRQLWQKAGRRDRVPRQPGFSLRAGGQGAAVAPLLHLAFALGPGTVKRRGIRWSRPSTP